MVEHARHKDSSSATLTGRRKEKPKLSEIYKDGFEDMEDGRNGPNA